MKNPLNRFPVACIDGDGGSGDEPVGVGLVLDESGLRGGEFGADGVQCCSFRFEFGDAGEIARAGSIADEGHVFWCGVSGREVFIRPVELDDARVGDGSLVGEIQNDLSQFHDFLTDYPVGAVAFDLDSIAATAPDDGREIAGGRDGRVTDPDAVTGIGCGGEE